MSDTLSHVKLLAELSIPMILNALIQEVHGATTMIFVGALGSAESLGAATLGNMMCNITGYAAAYGMCSALDTLISQAYGASAYELMGLHAQRAMVILTILSIPIAALWLVTDALLIHMLQIDRNTSLLAGVWARWILIGLWPRLMFEVLRKLLQGCGIVWPVIIASTIGAVVNAASCYFTIHVLHWGLIGAAVSVGLYQWSMFLSLVLIFHLQIRFSRMRRKRNDHNVISQYSPDKESNHSDETVEVESQDTSKLLLDASILIGSSISSLSPATRLAAAAVIDPHVATAATSSLNISFVPSFPLEEVWPSIGYPVLTNWSAFLSLGLPSAVSLMLDWGSFELMAGIAGQLGAVVLATHGVYMTTCSLFYMVPQSVAEATAVLGGNFLGNMKPEKAKAIIRLGICYDACVGLVSGCVLLFALKPHWGPLFSSSLEVQQHIQASLPIMLVYISADSIKCISSTIVRSIGKPYITIYGNAFSCLFIMIPLAFHLGIVQGMELWGIWGAMSVAWCFAAGLYLAVIYRIDWDAQAVEAVKRTTHELNKHASL